MSDQTHDDPSGPMTGDDDSQSEALAASDKPLGGDEGTEDELEADNDVEEDMIATLHPDAPPA